MAGVRGDDGNRPTRASEGGGGSGHVGLKVGPDERRVHESKRMTGRGKVAGLIVKKVGGKVCKRVWKRGGAGRGVRRIGGAGEGRCPLYLRVGGR